MVEVKEFDHEISREYGVERAEARRRPDDSDILISSASNGASN